MTEDDLKQLLMFSSPSKNLNPAKESLTKENLIGASTTPYKVSVLGSGSKRSPNGAKVGVGKESWTKDSL